MLEMASESGADGGDDGDDADMHEEDGIGGEHKIFKQSYPETCHFLFSVLDFPENLGCLV